MSAATLKQMLVAISRGPHSDGSSPAHEAAYLHLFLLRLAQDIPEVAARIKERYAIENDEGDTNV